MFLGWSQFFEFLLITLGIFITFSPFLIYLNRKKQKKAFANIKQLEAIDYKALNEAEEAVKNFDIKKYLYENFVPVIELQTLHGYDNNSMTDITVKLKEKGINSEYHFIQALPMGKGSAVTPIGSYQVFIEKNKVEEGKKALAEILKA